jgi:hypothetical protein
MNIDYNDHRSDKRRLKTSMEGNKDVRDHISHQYRSLPSAASVFLINGTVGGGSWSPFGSLQIFGHSRVTPSTTISSRYPCIRATGRIRQGKNDVNRCENAGL